MDTTIKSYIMNPIDNQTCGAMQVLKKFETIQRMHGTTWIRRDRVGQDSFSRKCTLQELPDGYYKLKFANSAVSREYFDNSSVPILENVRWMRDSPLTWRNYTNIWSHTSMVYLTKCSILRRNRYLWKIWSSMRNTVFLTDWYHTFVTQIYVLSRKLTRQF